MPWKPIKKQGEFIHCPQCESTDIVDTDYEIDDAGTVDEDGRHCNACGWEGDDSELVAKDD